VKSEKTEAPKMDTTRISASECMPKPERDGAARKPLPLPELVTYRREDFELPLAFTGCASLSDCPGD